MPVHRKHHNPVQRCPKGHYYSEKNTVYRRRGRECVICGNARRKRKDEAVRAKRARQPKVYRSSKATQARVDALWANMMSRPDTQYKAKMLEAKREYDEWIATQVKGRLSKKGTKGRPIACGANNP